jgi:predicted nucleotidyltransferase
MCAASGPFQGTAQLQALQAALVDFYALDPRVLCVAVFGSLGRGDWRPDSDLDLDIVVGNTVQIQLEPELRRLGAAFEAIGERAALVIPVGGDSGDVVFESLMQLSIRYHSLANTSPNILSGLRVLGGRLSQAEVEAAAGANLRPPSTPPSTRSVDDSRPRRTVPR